jgi:ATP-dependent RNA helicase RhlB
MGTVKIPNLTFKDHPQTSTASQYKSGIHLEILLKRVILDPMTEDPETEHPAIRAKKPNFLTKTKFDHFDLPREVLSGLGDAGFVSCTPIQAQVLPVALTGRDVAGQAQTGTGKTAAFLVTIFTRLLASPERKSGVASALIVAPTRELALQIYHDAEILGRYTGLSFVQIVGGVDYRKQAESLRRGVDVIICTPGRIIDYLKQGIFRPDTIRIVVIDEADRLFDLGFTKDMRYILRKLPHYENRQSMLFSATLSHRVLALTYDYMNLPDFISVTPEEVTVDGIQQTLLHVGVAEKLSLLLGLLEREDWTRILIFVNTKAGVEWLSKKLKGNGLPAEGITGDLPQRKRFGLMERFKEGSLKILVATDVASRGIHVEDISHVINYDLPQDVENYVHRIGRTARAGKTGRALTLASEDYIFHLEPLEDLLGYKIPVVWPEDEWFSEDKSGPIPAGERGRWKRPTQRGGRRAERTKGAHRGRPRDDSRGSTQGDRFAHPKKIKTSSQPGGVFGLVPVSESSPGAKKSSARGPSNSEKKKKTRPKKKGRPKAKSPSLKAAGES